ncbi:MAG: DUF3047 domain-containing protein [Rhodospirillales bacterium]|nr:DUF3047 domain-containing protein [Rhodospirillales bacterium]
MLLLAVLAGCAVVPRAAVGPRGLLEVLGPAPGFTPQALSGDWIVEGYEGTQGSELAVIRLDGVPALRIVNGEDGFLVVRRRQAMLLATPYLSWSWNVEDHGDGYHPVRLIVGFHGGDPKSASWGSQPFAWTGSALPPHDRALVITWGASALERGTLSGPTGERRSAPRYTARGGRENTGSWWLETIDLSRLYARAWPGDDAGEATVVFIGLAAGGGRAPAVANFSGMVLSR